MNVNEASKMTGLAKRTIYNLCSKREIPHSKFLSKLKFDEVELKNWITSRTEIREEIKNA
jgi:excisionase family DNA binding protein